MPDIGIVQTLNSTRKLQMDVQVITLDDNLTHPYFSYIEMLKDNSSPVGVGRLFAPHDSNMLQYWSKTDMMRMVTDERLLAVQRVLYHPHRSEPLVLLPLT